MFTGQTFWRTVAMGWLVDEDCHREHGRRREAVFVGGVSLVSSIGRALAVGLVINGLAWAGLDMTNCSQPCSDLAFDAVSSTEAETEAACIEECDLHNIANQ